MQNLAGSPKDSLPRVRRSIASMNKRRAMPEQATQKTAANAIGVTGFFVDPGFDFTDPDEETFWPGQPKDMYAQLTGEREIVNFSRDDGANWHCEPMGRAEVELKMLDFFRDRLAKRQ
jgi:hypothetical protein